ncbi:hypothetical protein PTSG_11944 [Salpingoeca rosetta]|uniref:Uncharacterized protein n=1 Tax=Salpingoeca rosetta (strain ATCC 50818 / BSB-021) TaxID=946362 RepID=F2U3U3_SALR5|nr:uncharacterized protein PTSG_11944 [Salpingoeca rosetta]EGD82287.1 hypothetical protein PTSG_11944 [Salpingoeca rosetta]|eukprot:XP_004996470.1 hypothetical protein PTSG_11944 [Salpingoeca rosetta]
MVLNLLIALTLDRADLDFQLLRGWRRRRSVQREGVLHALKKEMQYSTCRATLPTIIE